MGRNVHVVVEKEFEDHVWQRVGEPICGSYSKFAEKIIIWDAMDMDGCGDFFATPKDFVSAAWECRHDTKSLEDIRGVLTWLRNKLRAIQKSYKEYANEYFRFNVS